MQTNAALDTHKLGGGIPLYASMMERNVHRKKEFFITEIDRILFEQGRIINILDVGCCSGELISSIKAHFRDAINIEGVDLSEKMLTLARIKSPEIRFTIGNAYNLEHFGPGSKDVIIYSSLLHELGSYCDETHSQKSYDKGILKGLKTAENILTQGGCLMIKDPVMPLNGDESAILQYKKPITPTHITNLSDHSCPNGMNYWDRVRYFLSKSPWTSNRLAIENGIISCTMKDVNEIARHTSSAIGVTWEHFHDELKEWYGSWNSHSWNSYNQKGGTLTLRQHHTFFNDSNHSVDFYNHFHIYNERGNLVNHKDTFPTHQHTVLQKI